MNGTIVIGHGTAGQWSTDASDVTREDADLIAEARRMGLLSRAHDVGCADRDGNMLKDGWLCVVADSDGLEDALNADPSVISYCDAPEAR